MAKFIIKGRKPLKGEIGVSGNKNAILPIMAATVLTSQECILENVPQIDDVLVMGELIKDIGGKIEGLGTDRLIINNKSIKKTSLDPRLVKKLRGSILLLGPLLARFGKAHLRHPGGDIIGRRAVGTHFDALTTLGAQIIVGEENYEAEVKKLQPAKIFLDEMSVTATENTLMMASLIPGRTVIEDAACEPHIEDLANFLNKMGARIAGAGTNTVTVEGKKNLTRVSHTITPDYIDVGTFAIMAAITKGRVKIKKIEPNHLRMILLYFSRFGIDYEIKDDSLLIGPSRLIAPKGKIQTRPWPGFPSDLMSPLIVLSSQAEGTTLCHDWMYESRMFFVDKLIAMGASITICDPHRVLVYGPTKLIGKEMESPDIRAGMALICAALCAANTSIIKNVEIVERGYEDVGKRLKALGADIKRVE